ncbi:hypothetical protein Tco_0377194 [Tanacetum coccineum]
MVPPNNLRHDLNGKAINETQYRGMIGSLVYLTATRPDIQFSTCLCARYQANPKESHLIVVKRIFRKSTSDHILKGDIELHFIPTQYQLADIFTKPPDEPTFKRLIVELEEHVTLDKPESPNPFLPAIQVEFTFEEMAFTTNNEVAHLYPSHPNQEYFKDVSDFISKCYLKEAFTRAPNQYKEYLSELWYTEKVLSDSKIWLSTPTGEVRGEIGITTFRNALKAQYLPHSSMYVSPPSITTIRPWFATIGYNGEIGSKGTLKKSCLPPRRRLLMGQIIQCLGGKTGGLDQISNKDATILCACGLQSCSQGKKPGARSGLRRKQSLKRTSESTTKASKSQSGHSKKETKSSSDMDTSPSHPSPPTLVVGEIHKEAQQAAGGPTSLGATSEEGAHLQLSSASGHDASADSIAEADPGISAPSDFVPQQQGMNEGTKNTSYDHIIAGSNPSVLVYKTKSAGDGLKTAHTTSGANKTSRADDISQKAIIVLDESEEDEEVAKDKDTKDTSKEELEQAKVKVEAGVASMKAKPSYPDINQLTEFLVTFLKPELPKLFASHDFASCLPTELKELSSKITELSGEIKELMQHVRDMEIELPRDLVEIPTKLETFTSAISSLSSQVAKLKNIQWKLPAEFLSLPSFPPWWTMHQELQACMFLQQAKQLLHLLRGRRTPKMPYYTKKLLFDKYCDKMLKRKKNPKITNCEVLTKKGHITLKIYREDGSDEVISNLKVSDLHSAEWREVLQAYPDKNEKGWKTIYDQVKTRVDQLTQTEQELNIDLNQPLKEQDPLNRS